VWQRIVLLSHLTTLDFESVWRLPLFVWHAYAEFHDRWLAQANQRGSGRG
jgi:hypothetical protein